MKKESSCFLACVSVFGYRVEREKCEELNKAISDLIMLLEELNLEKYQLYRLSEKEINKLNLKNRYRREELIYRVRSIWRETYRPTDNIQDTNFKSYINKIQ